MYSNNFRIQRQSFPYLESFDDALSLDQSLADVDTDDAWKLFGLQSLQCLGGQDRQTAMGTLLRTPHDDLCAHPPKCLTGGNLGSSHASYVGHAGHHVGNVASSSHMLFHTRHFDPQAVSRQSQIQDQSQNQHMHGVSTGPQTNGLNHLMDFSAESPFSQSMSTADESASGASKPFTPFAVDFTEELSPLSSPPTRSSMRGGGDSGGGGGDDDAESTCNSDCGFGEICHDTACSDDPSPCCEDEECPQEPSGVPSHATITSEDAIAAAAALTSIAKQQKQASERQEQASQQQKMVAAASSGMHNQSHHHSVSSTSAPSCLQFGVGPDMCISPEFLTNYQHLREAHNPVNPSACTASFCPVEDPSFYQECHIRHASANQGGLFDNIDLDQMMGAGSGQGHDQNQSQIQNHPLNLDHNHNHMGAIECGARFPSGEAMVQHLWNEHRKGLNLLQFPAVQQNLHMGHVPGMNSSSAPSSVLLTSQDLASTPSLVESSQDETVMSLSDASLPLAAYDFYHGQDHNHNHNHSRDHSYSVKDTTAMVLGAKQEEGQSKLGAALDFDTEDAQQLGLGLGQKVHECLWCNTVGSQPCSQMFGSAEDLNRHVLATHTHMLKRDSMGTYPCGWIGCTRHGNAEKGGFTQKSKMNRHIQVHTGNKPFMCDICHQSFSANQALVQHKLIHEDSKPLSCPICEKPFRQHSALTMHIRTHTKERPLKCPHCDKEFSESSNLSKHKRIHAGDGQYECKFPGCDRKFRRRDQLRRHSLNHSPSMSSYIVKPSTKPGAG